MQCGIQDGLGSEGTGNSMQFGIQHELGFMIGMQHVLGFNQLGFEKIILSL